MGGGDPARARSAEHGIVSILAAQQRARDHAPLRVAVGGTRLLQRVRLGRLELEAAFEEPEVAPAPSASVQTFEAAARGAIEAALRASSGKLYGDDGAAALLGLKPSTLQTKMRKYGIERRRFVRD